MHVITNTCVLFLWMHLVTFVQSQGCTLQEFIDGRHYDSNFDITGLEASYAGGRQVRVGCNIGYTGFFKLICVEGQWQTRGSKCQPKSCGHPGDAQFADFHLEEGDDFVFGSKVVYTCHKGYQMVSRTKFRRCMAEGWDGVVPVCEAQQCPVIHVGSNVQVIGDPEEANYGNVVRFRCKSSSEVLEGSAEMYCDENGQWSGTEPKCTEIKCTVPRIEHGVVLGGVQEYKENQVLNYRCDPQYKRAEERQSRCLKVGTKAEWSPTPACESNRTNQATCTRDGWTPKPLCKGTYCTKPNIENAEFTYNLRDRYSHNDRVHYTCRNSNRNTFTITCIEGDWTGIKTVVPNGFVVGPYQDKLYYTCDDGYKLFTKGWWAEARCIGGVWSGLNQCIDKRFCGETPVIPNGKVSPPVTGAAYSSNIICNEGYYKIFIATDPPPKIQNAVVLSSYQKEYLSDSEVTYWCRDKFIMKGEDTIKCNNGQWEEKNIMCIRYCDKLNNEKQSMNFTSDKDKYLDGDVIEYQCIIPDPVAKGSATCVDGKWNKTVECKVKPCPRPDETPNGSYQIIEGEDFVFGTAIQYVCDQGYQVVGDDTLNCNLDGWTGKAPTCKRKSQYQQQLCFEFRQLISILFCSVDMRVLVSTLRGFVDIIFFLSILSGFYLSLFSVITCEVGVLHPNLIVTGIISASEPVQVGYKLQFDCSRDFHLDGSNETECLPTGQWSAPIPTCSGTFTLFIGKMHPRLFVAGLPPPNERIKTGHKLQFQCSNDLTLNGSEKIECLQTGQWSAPFPTCSAPVGCGKPPPLADGDTKETVVFQYRHNAKVEYICQNVYHMEGGPFKTCKNGEWIGQMRCLSNKLQFHECYTTDFRKHFQSLEMLKILLF
uniref:Sushi domain-containing protein n=1 Tax=Acanthochromis polyacanthus TaxID=80966 RepID=A0A3Q1EEN8_9TELE